MTTQFLDVIVPGHPRHPRHPKNPTLPKDTVVKDTVAKDAVLVLCFGALFTFRRSFSKKR